MTQFWIHIYRLPLEFRGKQNLINITAMVGASLMIDPSTLTMYQGLYTRVLVDMDLSRRLPERILASLKNDKKNINFNFLL